MSVVGTHWNLMVGPAFVSPTRLFFQYGADHADHIRAAIKVFGLMKRSICFAHHLPKMYKVNGSFHEAEHLDGSADMVGVIRAILEEESRRRREGRSDHEVPMRPDHGHLLADDIGKKVYPGYSLVGRLKGLAELRGVVRGLKYENRELAG